MSRWIRCDWCRKQVPQTDGWPVQIIVGHVWERKPEIILKGDICSNCLPLIIDKYKSDGLVQEVERDTPTFLPPGGILRNK